MQSLAQRWRGAGFRIALVPTMGALHAGHGSLVREARRRVGKKGKVVVSIYVNPTQFGPKEDLARYPRPRRADTAFCRELGADLLFAPANLYAPGHSTWIDEEDVSQGRDGGSRPGHFRGVATVVAKLFHLALPHIACFGRKDAQQLEVIQRMVRDLDFPVSVVPVETVRDRDGLALSSRNRYLSASEREQALALPLLLQAAAVQPKPVAWLEKHLRRAPGLRIDYVALAGGRLCAATWVGTTRLIDNVPCVPASR
jgi:pantoate--beta-alanine ligase